jgi:hypothetical protein
VPVSGHLDNEAGADAGQLTEERALFAKPFFKKRGCPGYGGERTRSLSISFIFSFSPLYR